MLENVIMGNVPPRRHIITVAIFVSIVVSTVLAGIGHVGPTTLINRDTNPGIGGRTGAVTNSDTDRTRVDLALVAQSTEALSEFTLSWYRHGCNSIINNVEVTLEFVLALPSAEGSVRGNLVIATGAAVLAIPLNGTSVKKTEFAS